MVVKPSPNYHFWCIQQVENNDFGGCFQKFWKICVRNFFLQNLNQKFWKIQFWKIFVNQTVLSIIKYQFEMISAFIWSIYCPYWSKITDFLKIYILKAENFSLWNEVTLKPHCGNILDPWMIFKDSIEEWICQMSLDTISGEFGWKIGV